MKHGIKKIKFNRGQDANQALMRKLITNFIEVGRITTTLSKAKLLKGLIDRLVYKAMQGRESDKNVLLKHFGKKTVVKHMISTVGPAFAGQKSGYTKLFRIGPRQGDNAEMVRLEWVRPITVTPPAPVESKTKPVAKSKLTKKKNNNDHTD